MAQLPPKVPNLTPIWPITTTNSSAAAVIHSPSWVDEFLDFSTIRRGSHRRSISDSITFIETPLLDSCHNYTTLSMQDFDKIDDKQLMSMFSDDITIDPTLSSSSSIPSSPSDHQESDKHLHPKSEPDELPNSSPLSVKPAATNSPPDMIIDPKRVKRIIANRQSAQRSRVRKLQYISELERSLTSLQAQVSVLSPRVAFLDHQRLILNVDNSSLKQRIAALAQDNIFKDAHQDAMRREIERLRKVYQDKNYHPEVHESDDSKKNPTENCEILKT